MVGESSPVQRLVIIARGRRNHLETLESGVPPGLPSIANSRVFFQRNPRIAAEISKKNTLHHKSN
jgi:hypothetical protein